MANLTWKDTEEALEGEEHGDAAHKANELKQEETQSHWQSDDHPGMRTVPQDINTHKAETITAMQSEGWSDKHFGSAWLFKTILKSKTVFQRTVTEHLKHQ